MMPLTSYLAFVAASVALVLIPGPNVAFIVGTSLSGGARHGIAAVAGTSSAMLVQLAAVFLGFAMVLASAGSIFEVLRWAGIAYLLLLGCRALRARPEPTQSSSQVRCARAAFLRGFAVSLTNPKTLLFYGAFLPQFLDPRRDVSLQLLLLSATFLLVATTLDCGWALLAGRLRGVLSLRPHLRNRLAGASLIGAAAGLALMRETA